MHEALAEQLTQLKFLRMGQFQAELPFEASCCFPKTAAMHQGPTQVDCELLKTTMAFRPQNSFSGL